MKKKWLRQVARPFIPPRQSNSKLIICIMGVTILLVFIFAIFQEILAIEASSHHQTRTSGDHTIFKFDIRVPHQSIPTAKGITKIALPPDDWWKTPAPPSTNESLVDWKPVLGSTFKFFVYSAYYDNRPAKPFIRVIGGNKNKLPGKAWCRVTYNKTGDASHQPGSPGEQEILVQGKIKSISEHWNLLYSASFILCPLPTEGPLAFKVPSSVTITKSSDDTEIGNRVQVLPISNPGKEASGLAVCVKPIHGNYNKLMQLMEFLETYKALGARKFTFYNGSMSSDANCLLHYHISEGLVEVLPWSLPFISKTEIRTEGIFAALNDCLYRNMAKYKYIVMIDLDEVIVPHQTQDLISTLKLLETKASAGPGHITLRKGSFIFQNAFFYLEWPDDVPQFPHTWPLVALRKTRRRATLHPHRDRSKYIVVARYVIEVGNHFVWEHMRGYGALTVSPEIAMVHHYRQCEHEAGCTKCPSTVDRTARKFANAIFANFHDTMGAVSPLCGITNQTLIQSPLY